jgi:CheY-like chemotaxis protein
MKRVLVAEDNAVNRELIRELLELRGYEVTEACDGQEALEMMEASPPDILLLDLGMPKLDGFDVIKRVRENPNLDGMPVLAVTAYAMRGDKERVLDAGFDGYLSKPINGPALTQALENLLRSSKS